jgi:hypothetical protein
MFIGALQVEVNVQVSINMSTTNYSTLFLKLWKELHVKETQKNPNLNTKIIPTIGQKNLLM